MDNKSKLELASQILMESRDAVLEIVNGMGAVSIEFKNKFDLMINKVAFLGGFSVGPAKVINFPPVTNFMGDEITTKAPIKLEDLSPKELERKIFAEKIDKLYNGLSNITDEEVLESYKNDQLVLRGLAKRAGMESYRDGVIDLAFIHDIRMGFKAQEDYDNKLKKAEKLVVGTEDENPDEEDMSK